MIFDITMVVPHADLSHEGGLMVNTLDSGLSTIKLTC